MEFQFLREVSGSKRLLVRLRNNFWLIELISLPKNDAYLVEGKVSRSEEFNVFVSVVFRPALPISLLNPSAILIGNPISLIAKGFRLFLKLFSRVNDHHATAMTSGLFVPQKPYICKNSRVVIKLIGK